MLYDPDERKPEKIIVFLSTERDHVNRIKHSAYIVIGVIRDLRGKWIRKVLFEKLDKWAMEQGVVRLM